MIEINCAYFALMMEYMEVCFDYKQNSRNCMKTHSLIRILFSISLFSLLKCTKTVTKNGNQNSDIKKETKNISVEIDTIKRNEQIVYNITKDTIVGDYEISVNNKNIEDKYIKQSIKINDSIVVENFYPEMQSTIIIKKNGVHFFEKLFKKNDLPTGTFKSLLSKAIMKDFIINGINIETNEISFTTTLLIPNTDFENDFFVKINKNGNYNIEWIDYESE